MTVPTLYRRRFIPDELICLKDDVILEYEKDFILTKWVTLHPRKDIARGVSAYYLDQGYKISKIYNAEGQLVYWYCDIIKAAADSRKNTVVIEDLLIDIILYNDGSMQIADLDELADALEKKLVSEEDVTYALRVLNNLLKIISSKQFHTLQEPINRAEPF